MKLIHQNVAFSAYGLTPCFAHTTSNIDLRAIHYSSGNQEKRFVQFVTVFFRFTSLISHQFGADNA